MLSLRKRLGYFLPAMAGLCIGAGEPASQTMHTYWRKIGGWSMHNVETTALSIGGIPPSNVVAVTVIIHSDPVVINGTSRVEVDRLDRNGHGEVARDVTPSNYHGRGGSFELQPSGSLVLYRGPSLVMGAGQRNRFMQGLHTSTSVNRGWVRIDYVGNPVEASQPYAVKTKVLTMGSWNMTNVFRKEVNMSNLGSPANRIASFTATLKSDDQSVASDFIRTGPSGSFGGIAVITDKVTPPSTVMLAADPVNYFNDLSRSWNFDDQGNRGFIKVDYLAAECGEGSGFTKSFIGAFTPDGADCHGYNGSVHVVQTKGPDIWGSADKFAFINKTRNLANTMIKARVDRIENTNSWARAGIMIRAHLNANSRHVHMVVTPKPASGNGNGISFGGRTSDGGSAFESSPNTFSAPYWVLIRKDGIGFRGYMSTTGTGDPVTNPGSWTQVGGTISIADFPGNYYVGLCQSAGNNSPVLNNTSVYSNLNF